MDRKDERDRKNPEELRDENPETSSEQTDSRREFLVGLGKWSAIIVGAVLGLAPTTAESKKNYKYWDQPSWSNSPWNHSPWNHNPWYHNPWNNQSYDPGPGPTPWGPPRCRCECV